MSQSPIIPEVSATSDTSTIRSESPKQEESAPPASATSWNLFPSALIPPRQESMSSAELLLSYQSLGLEILRCGWREDPGVAGLSGLNLASFPKIITFFSNQTSVVPRAMIVDPKLVREFAAWMWCTFRNTDAPSTQVAFPIERMLVLLTDFTRGKGSNADMAFAMDMSHAACIHVLQNFQTPTTYQREEVHPRHYYGMRLALHYHRNHFANEDTPQMGRLDSWRPHRSYLELTIQQIGGQLITQRVSWEDVADLSSVFSSFPPLFNRDIAPYGSIRGPDVTGEVAAGVTSTGDAKVSQINSGSEQRPNKRRRLRDRRQEKAKRRTKVPPLEA